MPEHFEGCVLRRELRQRENGGQTLNLFSASTSCLLTLSSFVDLIFSVLPSVSGRAVQYKSRILGEATKALLPPLHLENDGSHIPGNQWD